MKTNIVATIEEKIEERNLLFLVRDDGKYSYIIQPKEEMELGVNIQDTCMFEAVDDWDEDCWFSSLEESRKEAIEDVKNFNLWDN